MKRPRLRRAIPDVVRNAAIGTLVLLPGSAIAQLPLAATLNHLGQNDRASVVAPRSQRADARARSPLDRMIVLNVRDLPVEAVLDSIAMQAGVNLVYGDMSIPKDRKVTMRDARLSVGEALKRVLSGTGVVPHVNPSGGITLVKRAEQDSTKPAPSKGKISGRVIDSATQQPLVNAVVSIRGTRYAVQTQSDGSFAFPEVPSGAQVVFVRMLGFASKQVTVTVTDAPQQINFSLRSTATQLSDVVTTATGQQERVTVGNSIATIKADEVVATMPIRTVSDLLEARVPGLTTVRSSGAVGAGVRLRVRGVRTTSMSNDPIVILDGIRISGDPLSGDRDANLPGKGTRPSRLDDIDPTTIETIDVLKGPSAAALYGSDAANGVIVIKTKRPQAGPPRWQLTADRTNTSYPGDYPVAVRTFGHTLTGSSAGCTLTQMGIGGCPVLDSVVTFDVMGDPRTTPFANGYDSQISANVSGGSQVLRYFLSGSFADQLGASKVPDMNVRIFERIHGPGSASKSFRRPNAVTNTNFTGTVSGQLGDIADFSLRSTILSRYQRRGNDGLQGVFSTLNVRSAGDTFTAVQPSSGLPHERSDRVLRSATGIAGNWRPLSWLSGQAGYGFDFWVNNDRDFVGRNRCQPFCGNSFGGEADSIGIIWFGRRQTQVHSGNAGLAGQWTLPRSFGLQLNVGGQYVRTTYTDLNGFASDLPAGRKTANAANGRKNIDEITDDAATAGWYFTPRASWRDRMYLSIGFRQDVGSGIGADVRPVYPKWDFSYLVSEEDFFAPLSGIVNTFRVRGAFGQAGLQPGGSFKIRSFSQLPRFVLPNGTQTNYAQLIAVGNEDLRPERGSEFEWGLDAELFDSRVRVDLTWFRETTRDAIMARPLAPSVGTTTTRRENVGEISNTGMEGTIGATIIRSARLSYDLNIGFDAHESLLKSLGPNVAPFSQGFFPGNRGIDEARIVPGYSLFARWAKPIAGFYDANADGIIDETEIRYGDSLVYRGTSMPKYKVSLHHSVGLLQDRLRVAATFQYVHGLTQVNRYYADNAMSSPALSIQGLASPLLMAYAAAARATSLWGFVEDANTLRLNTLSAQATLPNRWARSVRASQATVMLIGSNLGMWSTYSGADPSVNTAGAQGNRVADEGGLPTPRSWGFRVALTF